MSSPIRAWIAVGVLGFVGSAALRPGGAWAAPAQDDDEPTVTPSASNGAPPAPPRQGPPRQTPPTQAAPYQAPPYQPPPGYPPPGYPGYPPPGYPPPAYAPPGYPPYGAYPGYPPMQLQKVHKPRRGLVTGGAITFGVSWGIAASISFVIGTSTCNGSSSCNDSADYLWIPIAGPLVVAAKESSSDSPGIFILWSAAQAAGVIMFVVGMVGHDVMEYRVAKNGPTLTLAPLFARETTGLGLTARW
jgi:hypothetical protein